MENRSEISELIQQGRILIGPMGEGHKPGLSYSTPRCQYPIQQIHIHGPDDQGGH